MQENKFEQQMQQQMKDLQLRPSDDVWKKVEEELHKKKRRRFIIFFFTLAGLGLIGYAGYTILTPSNSILAIEKPNDIKQPVPTIVEQLQNEKSNVVTEKNVNTTSENKVDQNNNVQTGVQKNGSTTSPSADDHTKNNTASATGVTEKKNTREMVVTKETMPLTVKQEKSITLQQKVKQPKKSVDEKQVVSSEKKSKATDKFSIEADESATTKKVNTITKEVAIGNNQNVTVKNDTAGSIIAATKVDDSLGITQVVTAILDTAVTKLSADTSQVAVATASIKKGKRSIIWGLEWSAGSSRGVKNGFPILSLAEKALADRNFNSSPISSGGGQGSTIPQGPSPIRAGFSYRVGLIGQLSIGKRKSISTGISYAYLSDRITIGTYRNASFFFNNFASQTIGVRAAYVYIGTDRQSFTNRYHFIQVPVAFQWQLNKGKKIPISWNTGISTGYLFATNALVYDTAFGGIYYHSKEAFNRLQVHISTGFAFQLGMKGKINWSVGPEISLSAGKLVKDAYDSRRYLLYGGLTGKFNFTKPKK
jgi:hypothetical protein